MSRNPQDAPLPAAKFEPAATATVELTEIDGMEQGALRRPAEDTLFAIGGDSGCGAAAQITGPEIGAVSVKRIVALVLYEGGPPAVRGEGQAG